jgi:hypothetical protein
MRHRIDPVVGAVALSLLVLASCGSPAHTASVRPGTHSTTTISDTTGAYTSPSRAVTSFSHVFVVVMENLEYQSALATPGFAALAHRYAYVTDSYAASHPSLPNYLALTAGSTLGVTSDCLICYVDAPNLAEQLSAKHISWAAYFEDVSQPCYLGTSYGEYAAKHNPFRYFADIRSSARLCAHLLPYADLAPALRRPPSEVPRFVWVTPNTCDDGHDCSPASAATWLSSLVTQVTATAAWRDGGVLIVTWDEGSDGDTSSIAPSGKVGGSGGGGHVLTLVITPDLRRGTVISRPFSHYGVLATVERDFGLPYLGAAKAWSRTTLLEVPGLQAG